MVKYLHPAEIIRRLKVCSWCYNSVLKLGDKHHYGVIAQEVLDEFGPDYNFVDTSGQFMKVNYSEFIGPLIKCVQDQQTQIERQETRIQELENKLNTIMHSKEHP